MAANLSNDSTSWIYPQAWPGWSSHRQFGGGLFDDESTLLHILQACWSHFRDHCALALSPQSVLQIQIRSDAWDRWEHEFAFVREAFQPTVNNERIAFEWVPLLPEKSVHLSQLRDFTFAIAAPQEQPLKSCFFQGTRLIGSVKLGPIDLRGDRSELGIQRRFGLITHSSTIQKCYQNSAWIEQIPPKMLQDLKYLGWTLVFSNEEGHSTIELQGLADNDLEGGTLLLHEGQRFAPGEIVTFYQGEQEGEALPELTCHFIVLPENEEPTYSQAEHLALFLHEYDDKQGLEIRAWVRGPSLQEDSVRIQWEGKSLPLTTTMTASEGLQLYQTFLPQVAGYQVGQQINVSLRGRNVYGLALENKLAPTTPIRPTAHAQLQNQRILTPSQLQRPWDIQVQLEGPGQAPSFDLSAFVLWLQADAHPPVQIPLAGASGSLLSFRYLPRSIHLQIPKEDLAQSQTIQFFLEQRSFRKTPVPEGQWRLQRTVNEGHTQVGSLRLVDFENVGRILPQERVVAFSDSEELLLEGHRLQVIPQLTRIHSKQSKECWDLLLFEPTQGPSQIRLQDSRPGFFTVQADTSKASPLNDFRALWLSCGWGEHEILDPRERNPEGGPCFAWGLGVGQTQEMAQLRPSPEGFRLYRHRQKIDVFRNGDLLPFEPHQGAQGCLLPRHPGNGWILLDRALLHYQYTSAQQLELTHLGFLFQRTGQAGNLAVTCGGKSSNPPEDPRIPHIALPGNVPPVRLSLNTLSQASTHRLPRLLLQENRPQADAASYLQFGTPYQQGPLSLTFWEASFGGTTRHPRAQQDNYASCLFLELPHFHGRKRYQLTTSYGRLGYWSPGSAFLPHNKMERPILAPNTPRAQRHGGEFLAGELIFGSDLTQADLSIPSFYRLSSPLLFTLSYTQQQLHLRPLTSCLHVTPQRRQDGRIFFEETPIPSDGSPISVHRKKPYWFRCGHVVFEVSFPSEGILREQPKTDLMLSICGIFQSAAKPFQIGGSSHNTPLPILDHVPQHDPREPLFFLYQPDLQMSYRGEGLIGLRRAETLSLLEQLQQKLDPIQLQTFSKSQSPLASLSSLVQTSETQANSIHPPLQEPLPQANAFLSEHQGLTFQDRLLRYRHRSEADGYPRPDRAPAQLEWETPPSLSFRKVENGFALPDGREVQALVVGRWDPQNEAEAHPSDAAQSQCFLSKPYNYQGRLIAKIVLFGYSPRQAIWLENRAGEVYLQVPQPKHANMYHITCESIPCRETTEFSLNSSKVFHINHLLLCEFSPSDTDITFLLRGYLLGNQQDPSMPIWLHDKNRRGSVHIRGLRPNEQLQLRPDVCPPYLLPKQTGETSQQIELANKSKIALVDIAHWQRPPTFPQPPGTERLLWFVESPNRHEAFRLQPPHALPSAESMDEGSSFGWDGPTIAMSPDTASPNLTNFEDEGSSFAFGGHASHPASSSPPIEGQEGHSDDQPGLSSPSTSPRSTEEFTLSPSHASPSPTSPEPSSTPSAITEEFAAPSPSPHTHHTLDPSETSPRINAKTEEFQAALPQATQPIQAGSPSTTQEFASQDGDRATHMPSQPAVGATTPTQSAHTLTQTTHPPESWEVPEGTYTLGCFAAKQQPPRRFGFLYEYEGPQMKLGFFQQQLFAFPHTPAQEDREPHTLAIWRYEELLPLQRPQPLQHGDILLCGPAAFAVEFMASGEIQLFRRWLWLPPQGTIRLTGQEFHPSSEVLLSIGLTHVTADELGLVFPRQRGHSVEGDTEQRRTVCWPSVQEASSGDSIAETGQEPLPAPSLESSSSTQSGVNL